MKADSGGAPVAVDDVRFAYPGGAAHAFDLALPAATVAAVMGPSGSGKSTLLNLIAGFEQPASGKIMIGEREVTGLAPAARPVSMVFQENNLFAHLDVFSNVGLGCSSSLRLDAEDEAAILEALRRTGLAGKEQRLPHALSGGERQRVALARVLVRRQPVLLLDEAFASLGPALREEMLDLVAALQAERHMTVFLATHDPDDAARLAGTIVFVDEGRVAAVGPADAFLSGGGPEAFSRYVGGRNRTGKRRMSDRKKP